MPVFPTLTDNRIERRMIETNATQLRIKDFNGRTDILRGYL